MSAAASRGPGSVSLRSEGPSPDAGTLGFWGIRGSSPGLCYHSWHGASGCGCDGTLPQCPCLVSTSSTSSASRSGPGEPKKHRLMSHMTIHSKSDKAKIKFKCEKCIKCNKSEKRAHVHVQYKRLPEDDLRTVYWCKFPPSWSLICHINLVFSKIIHLHILPIMLIPITFLILLLFWASL